MLRMAACDVHLKRYRQAVDPLKGQMAGPYRTRPTSSTSPRCGGWEKSDGIRALRPRASPTAAGEPFARGNAQQPRLALHHRRRRLHARRMCSAIMSSAIPPAASPSAPIGVSGWWAYRAGKFPGGRRGLRSWRRAVPALGLPSLVDLLERAGLARGRTAGTRCGTILPHGHRLLQQLLRPAGAKHLAAGRSARPSRSSLAKIRGTPPTTLPTVGSGGAADRRWPQPRSAQRAAVRAAHVGRFAAAHRHDRAGPEPPRQPSPRHQRDEARLPAVAGRRRRVAADRDPEGGVPARLLAAPAEACGRARARSVPRRRARGAGVDLRSGDPLFGQCRRPDAGAAVDGPAVRPQAEDRRAIRPRG